MQAHIYSCIFLSLSKIRISISFTCDMMIPLSHKLMIVLLLCLTVHLKNVRAGIDLERLFKFGQRVEKQPRGREDKCTFDRDLDSPLHHRFGRVCDTMNDWLKRDPVRYCKSFFLSTADTRSSKTSSCCRTKKQFIFLQFTLLGTIWLLMSSFSYRLSSRTRSFLWSCKWRAFSRELNVESSDSWWSAERSWKE